MDLFNGKVPKGKIFQRLYDDEKAYPLLNDYTFKINHTIPREIFETWEEYKEPSLKIDMDKLFIEAVKEHMPELLECDKNNKYLNYFKEVEKNQKNNTKEITDSDLIVGKTIFIEKANGTERLLTCKTKSGKVLFAGANYFITMEDLNKDFTIKQ